MIEESARSWDDRNYWKKAEALREKWRWSRKAARELETLLVAERWEEVPPLLISLVPHFADVTVQQLTRSVANLPWTPSYPSANPASRKVARTVRQPPQQNCSAAPSSTSPGGTTRRQCAQYTVTSGDSAPIAALRSTSETET